MGTMISCPPGAASPVLWPLSAHFTNHHVLSPRQNSLQVVCRPKHVFFLPTVSLCYTFHYIKYQQTAPSIQKHQFSSNGYRTLHLVAKQRDAHRSGTV